jgi:hypothetical protein
MKNLHIFSLDLRCFLSVSSAEILQLHGTSPSIPIGALDLDPAEGLGGLRT